MIFINIKPTFPQVLTLSSFWCIVSLAMDEFELDIARRLEILAEKSREARCTQKTPRAVLSVPLRKPQRQGTTKVFERSTWSAHVTRVLD
jgi:hypothetical protein